jgi:acyl CoA:acetate/3-ketoacid CoA transferase alpha subunit/acyl CoA:acetate/3-ketoacid CoA transferase beta subunit
MDEEYRQVLGARFNLFSGDGGSGKVRGLKEAIEEHVRPGMTLFFELNQSIRSNAAIYELVRRFHGKNPQFTLIIAGMGSNAIVLVQAGILKKIITAFVGEGFPFPGPNKRWQKAYKDKEVEIENWSILSIPLRLMAGAMGIGFMPTNSLEGSQMAEDNSDAFKIIDDPFEEGRKQAVLKPLNPDVTFVHGIAADPMGNTILTSPLGDGGYGIMGSRQGTIVTVEKIVSPELIRKYSHMVKVPGHLVKAVCEAPLGAHPFGVNNHGIEELRLSYAEDNVFIKEVRQASKSEESLEKFMREWVLDCGDHDGFLKKLGYERIMFLKGKSAPDSWKYELEDAWDEIPKTDDYNGTEWMVVAAARKIREKILKNDYQTVLAGVGASNLAAWLAYYDLRDQGRIVNLMAEIGLYGYEPRPSDPFIFNSRNVPTSRMLSDVQSILGIHAAGGRNQCMGVLGAVHVVRSGDLNSTLIPEMNLFMMGSGGANDVVSGAREVLVCVAQDKNRYVEKAPYITSPGKRIKTAVSDMGIFEKPDEGEELVLTGYFSSAGGSDGDEKISEIREKCGWDFKVAEEVEAIGPPTSDELKIIRLCDPHGYFLGRRNK